jgi:hypothetical protein
MNLVGANLYLQSGSGATNKGGYRLGLGNLIIGYNEAPAGLLARERSILLQL